MTIQESKFKNITSPEARNFIVKSFKQARKMYKEGKITKNQYLDFIKYLKTVIK